MYLYDPNVWVHKAELEQKAKDAGFLGDNCTRRLRELVAERVIEHRANGVSQEYRFVPDILDIAQVIDKI